MRNTCQLDAVKALINSIWSRGADRKPTMVLANTGKKTIVAVMITLEVMPKPNQSTNSGATATLGTVWKATTGCSAVLAMIGYMAALAMTR